MNYSLVFLLILVPDVGFCSSKEWFSISICLFSFHSSSLSCDLNSLRDLRIVVCLGLSNFLLVVWSDFQVFTCQTGKQKSYFSYWFIWALYILWKWVIYLDMRCTLFPFCHLSSEFVFSLHAVKQVFCFVCGRICHYSLLGIWVLWHN